MEMMAKTLTNFTEEISKKCASEDGEQTESYAGTPEKAALSC